MSELNSEAKALLASARKADTALGPARRARLRRAVLAGVAAWSTAAAASLSMTKLVLACLLSAGLGSALTLAVTRRPAPVASVSPAPSPITPPPPTTPPEEVTVVEPPAPPRNTPRRVEAVPAPSEVALPVEEALPAVTAPSLEEELMLLDQALAATDTQSWADADAALVRYKERFPTGTMQDEAGTLEVLTSCGQGRVEEARAQARLLYQRAPMNPSVQRLKRSCASQSP